MHLKRQTIGKFWPVPRKGTKYLARASHEQESGIPLSVVMRDVLGLVKNRKELQKLLNEKKVFINQKEIRDTSYPVSLFDTISLPLLKKYYRATLNNKRMSFEEIKEKEAEQVIFKIVNKKLLGKGKVQINLNNGKNILSDKKDLETRDFVVVQVKDNKILKNIKLEKSTDVVVIKGKHIGVYGKIKDIKEEGHQMIAEIESKDKEAIKVNLDNLFATN